VRLLDTVLAGIAAADFAQRVEVPNRDELGTFARNVNHISGELSALYQRLQTTVDEQVAALDRANNLKRYLPPGSPIPSSRATPMWRSARSAESHDHFLGRPNRCAGMTERGPAVMAALPGC
jgi:hypothetical protein